MDDFFDENIIKVNNVDKQDRKVGSVVNTKTFKEINIKKFKKYIGNNLIKTSFN